MAMFVLVMDTSLMNVSISAVVGDLDTTVSGVRSAIALEALVSAAFILISNKVGDVIGRKSLRAGAEPAYPRSPNPPGQVPCRSPRACGDFITAAGPPHDLGALVDTRPSGCAGTKWASRTPAVTRT